MDSYQLWCYQIYKEKKVTWNELQFMLEMSGMRIDN